MRGKRQWLIGMVILLICLGWWRTRPIGVQVTGFIEGCGYQHGSLIETPLGFISFTDYFWVKLTGDRHIYLVGEHDWVRAYFSREKHELWTGRALPDSRRSMSLFNKLGQIDFEL